LKRNSEDCLSTNHQWFDDSTKKWNRNALFDAVWNGDSEGITKEMNALLRRTISYHDYREDFYHAFLAGIFTGAGYMVDSNKEHLAYEKTNQEERKEQPT
jgi:hypothetical protein